MKSIFTFLFSVFAITAAFAQTSVDVVTGANYADDVYYSLENNDLKTTLRNTWDIAFTSQQMSVSVLANNGAGAMVYTWPMGKIDNRIPRSTNHGQATASGLRPKKKDCLH